MRGIGSLKARFFAHLAAIRFRKSGQPVTNLASLLAGRSYSELEAIAFDETDSISDVLGQGSIVKQQTANRLRKMGRKEGRTLRSSLARFALTRDVHVTANTKALNKLKIDDLEGLAGAFKDAITVNLKSL